MPIQETFRSPGRRKSTKEAAEKSNVSPGKSAQKQRLVTDRAKKYSSARTKEAEENETRVLHEQKYLHKKLEFAVDGKATLTAVQVKLMDHIKESFKVPFDLDSTDHGPLSRMSHEERVIIAYHEDKLEFKASVKEAPSKLCIECGVAGHKSRYCPTKLEILSTS